MDFLIVPSQGSWKQLLSVPQGQWSEVAAATQLCDPERRLAASVCLSSLSCLWKKNFRLDGLDSNKKIFS